MKKPLSLLLSVICLFTFAACGAKQGAEHGAEGWAKDWGITLTASNISSTGLTLVCTQSGGIAEGSLETGSAYWIEKYENGEWIEIKPQAEAVWDMMAHLIPSGETIEWSIDWSYLYGTLRAGQYRICKTVTDFKGPGGSESQNYFAEFEIK